ncbi:hypothetical protein E4U09_002258 [Claviceps aff. purpurea]|uniref:Uncharacterized protein n=1 Tax=Claviceps aff. purpurea TaxID=1967640 RepID=A0A9P7QU51_9HYPO|nr:hypothetical protein E4U09_002258 [Claviceps aff. purpurea]
MTIDERLDDCDSIASSGSVISRLVHRLSAALNHLHEYDDRLVPPGVLAQNPEFLDRAARAQALDGSRDDYTAELAQKLSVSLDRLAAGLRWKSLGN